MLEILPQLY